MSRQIQTFSDDLISYLRRKGTREEPILQELRSRTEDHSDSSMQITPDLGQLLKFLVSLTGARNILELGTYTGYSALSMALILSEDGTITTCDINEDVTKIARSFWEQAGVQHKIDLKIEQANQLLQKLKEEDHSFDLIFMDADKQNYLRYYEQSLPLLKTGGLLVIDNVLWGGDVVAPSHERDEKTETIRNLNDRIHQDERVTFSMLPLGDGVTLAHKVEV